MSPEMKQALAEWRNLENILRGYRDNTFKPGMLVRVDSPRFHGVGRGVSEHQCPADQLAVRLENGNIWYYPIEHCTPF